MAPSKASRKLRSLVRKIGCAPDCDFHLVIGVPRPKECGRSFRVEPKFNSSFLDNRRCTATVYAYMAEDPLLAFIFAGDDEFISCSITALIQGQFELEGAAAVQRPCGDVRFKRKRIRDCERRNDF